MEFGNMSHNQLIFVSHLKLIEKKKMSEDLNGLINENNVLSNAYQNWILENHTLHHRKQLVLLHA